MSLPSYILTSFRTTLLALSALLAAGAASALDIFTHHYDNGRTGWNPTETTLTQANIGAQFGLIATTPLDDLVDAQPLFQGSQRIVAGAKTGIYQVVYVATENNTVYAISAADGSVLLSRNLGAPVPAPFGCDNNGPHIGITGTPVIDTLLATINLITYTLNGTTPTYTLHALNLSDLTDRVPPVTVTASHALSNGSPFVFNALYQRQRAALAYVPRTLYAAFTSFCDKQFSHSRGWLLGWNPDTLAPLQANELTNTLATSPHNYFLSSIWMSGAGPAADLSKNLYVVTGNSDPSGTTFDEVRAIQESAVKIAPDLSKVLSTFTPQDWSIYDQTDLDFGSGGIMVLPRQSGLYPALAVAHGKKGAIFLLNRNSLGGYTPGGPDNVLDVKRLGIASNGCWCAPAYFQGQDGVSRIVTSGGRAVTVWKLQTSATAKPQLVQEGGATPITTGQDPGFFTSVSSNGTQAGTAIIWAVGRPTAAPFNITLYAFSANATQGPLTKLFSAAAGTWPFANSNANVVPVVSNGKVFVASYKQLAIFGLKGPNQTAQLHSTAEAAKLELSSDAHQITGTLVRIEGAKLTFSTRVGAAVTVDASRAKEAELAAILVVGTPYEVRGDYDAKGELVATSVTRAKPTVELWSPDR